jgi:hypothetical protein
VPEGSCKIICETIGFGEHAAVLMDELIVNFVII